jgi:hypothetical protein
MEYITKLLLAIISAILLISVVYIIFFTGEEEDLDTDPPVFISVKGNFSAMAGDVVNIYANFSDNIGIANASFYHRGEYESLWHELSIMNGSVDISIPDNSDDDIYFYFEIDDVAGNGPIRSPNKNNSYYIITVSIEDDGNGGNGGDDKENSHVVFVEEGTATWCSNCPEVAEILHDLYDPDNIDFYYVSLVEDRSSIAKTRLEADFNILGYPTVYVDGGYKVIFGSSNFESRFEQALSDAKNRNVPNIYLNLTSEWNETRKEVKNTVTIRNNDDEKYTGRLKIYITELVSSWRDYNDERYTNTLIDYGYNDEIELNGQETKNISKIWEASSNIDKDNLWIIAVVFNSEGKNRNSDPNDNNNPFEAYFADAAHGVKVTEEIAQTPPSIVITTPQDFSHYIFGNENKNSLLSKTYIIGKLTFQVDIEAEAGVEKVEYTINGPIRVFNATLTESPYSYEWDRFSFGKYTINVILYDDEGKTATDSIEVFIFNI